MIIVTSTFVPDIMQPDLSDLLKQFTQETTQFIYTDIFSQIWLFNSHFRQNQSGLNVLLIRLSDLLPAGSATSAVAVEQFITEWSYTLSLEDTPMQVPLLILFTPIPHHLQADTDFFANIASQIQHNIAKDPRIIVHVASELVDLCTDNPVESPYFAAYPHIPYSLEFYQTLNMCIARQYASFSEQPYLVPIEPLPYYVSPMEDMIQRHVLGLCSRQGLSVTAMDMPLIALGLDSLQAMLIATEIFSCYACDITPALLLSDTMNAYGLLEIILQAKPTHLPRPVLEQSTKIPLSIAQMRIWHDENRSEQSHKNHLFVAYEIPKLCDIALLERAFQTLITRHETLRFTFHHSEEGPFINILAPHNVAFEIQQHRAADDLSLTNFMDRFQQKAFDLAQAPLFRVSIVQTPHNTILLMCIHQIIHDAGSLAILCNELSILYLAYSHFIEPQLPSLTESYRDYILWQQQVVNIDTLVKQNEFWHSFLDKLPVTEFIYDKIQSTEDKPIGNQRVTFQVDRETSLCLKQIAAQHDITVYELLISAFGLLISHYSGQDDISFLIAVSSRYFNKMHRTMGSFVNLLLMRLQIPEELYWTQLLKNTKNIFNEILAHQDLPIQDILSVTGDKNHQAIFHQAAFIFLNELKPALILHDQNCVRLATYENPPILYDACKENRYGNLVCFMQETSDHLSGVFEYNASLFDPKMIEHIIQSFVILLNNISHHPPGYAKAIPLLNDQQKTLLFQQGHPRYILGPHLNPMPIGAPGKLYVHENALPRQNKPHSQKFVALGKENLCDTGDMVTWQIDGRLKYLSHINEQLDIDGYHIDPYKIESLLKSHAYIEEAIIMASQDYPPVLIAYILLKDHHQLAEFNLQQYLKPQLPQYMLPTRYYQIEHCPLTYNGKIDKQLLASSRLQPLIYPEYESATSPLQTKIMTIFAEVLKIDVSLIGIHNNFFDLGGNSISALRLIHRLSDQFHLRINFSILYEHGSIKLLSEQISSLLTKVNITQRNQGPQHILKKIKSGHPDQAPIIFIHPVGGTGFCYLELIKLLPDEQPCYLIHDPSIDAHQMLFDDIVSMAAYYNHVLLKHLPDTPCILAGYSFGGMLALEMVGQLERKNLSHCVQYIIAFDTWILSNIRGEQDKAHYKQHMNAEYKRITEQIRETQHSTSEPWMTQYYGQLQELGLTYIPPIIHKKIILFKAMQPINTQSTYEDPSNYLSAYTLQPIDIHPIACDHNSILNWPFIADIAQIMKHQLAPAYSY